MFSESVPEWAGLSGWHLVGDAPYLRAGDRLLQNIVKRIRIKSCLLPALRVPSTAGCRPIGLRSIYCPEVYVKIKQMADSEIQSAMDILDLEIESLQRARNRLAHALQTAPAQPRPILLHGKPKKEILAEFLIEHGPMSRERIVSETGLSDAITRYCLDDNTLFQQLQTGEWTTQTCPAKKPRIKEK